MSKYPEHFLTSALCATGDKTIPPAMSNDAGAGRFSQEKGWTDVTSRPLAEGGMPPKRQDFNGAFFLLSQFLLWYQQGGVMAYSADFDYEPTNEVFFNGSKFRCIKACGKSSKVVAPGSDKAYWKNLDAPSVIAGQVTPFVNCRLGGSDGRRLIPWGETVADERYVICDGGSDGRGGNVPNLIGKFIMPSTVDESGETGGGNKVSTTEATISGTVGETVLTLDQMPKHSHTGRSDTDGSHSHSRGSMNITGKFASYDHPGSGAVGASGAFYASGNYDSNTKSAGGDDWGKWFYFEAARSWSGYTSSSGSHWHYITLDSAGGGKGHTHTLTGASHAHELTLPLPPFFKLAYFVKLPE